MRIGQVTCDFISIDEFEVLGKRWLDSTSLHHVVTLNPEMVIQAELDQSFRQAVTKADIRVPDGAGLIWARWYLRSSAWSLLPSLIAFSFQDAKRITGVDTVKRLTKLAHDKGHSVYLLGGTPSQVQATARHLRQQFPTLTVHTSPDHVFDPQGPSHIVEDISAKKPAILFVAYGAPKQSIWIETHRANLPSVRIAVGVGGAFAIISEENPRAPRMLRRLNLEWLWRLLLEPSRLPRIWNAVVEFPRLVHRQKRAQ